LKHKERKEPVSAGLPPFFSSEMQGETQSYREKRSVGQEKRHRKPQRERRTLDGLACKTAKEKSAYNKGGGGCHLWIGDEIKGERIDNHKKKGPRVGDENRQKCGEKKPSTATRGFMDPETA